MKRMTRVSTRNTLSGNFPYYCCGVGSGDDGPEESGSESKSDEKPKKKKPAAKRGGRGGGKADKPKKEPKSKFKRIFFFFCCKFLNSLINFSFSYHSSCGYCSEDPRCKGVS